MRTTVDLPDSLVRAARVRAAEGDETLKELFTRALTRELQGSKAKQRGELPLIRSTRRSSVQISPAELEQVLIDDDINQLP
ncbi:hypothetical protein [Flexivirga oryzae]|uniref:Antitoxin n=1 Tax=Flexivirga oryzae TaxID=1794944 RepID=A0A839NER9_9MICO|nr:hypothetical protein [Flexivirga oryzae]MBB2893002.1 hypothetical protein [Flexivirga oryzae]